MKEIYFYHDGDIILVRVNKFSAWYRWLFAKLICLFDGVYYHHAQIATGTQELFEADTIVRRRNPSFNDGDELVIYRLINPMDEMEKYKFRNLLSQRLDQKYDYFGAIFHQLIYILTFRRIWIGKRGKKAEKRPYCTELVAGVMHDLRGYFPQPYLTSPSVLQKQLVSYYKVVRIISQ